MDDVCEAVPLVFIGKAPLDSFRDLGRGDPVSFQFEYP